MASLTHPEGQKHGFTCEDKDEEDGERNVMKALIDGSCKKRQQFNRDPASAQGDSQSSAQGGSQSSAQADTSQNLAK